MFLGEEKEGVYWWVGPGPEDPLSMRRLVCSEGLGPSKAVVGPGQTEDPWVP